MKISKAYLNDKLELIMTRFAKWFATPGAFVQVVIGTTAWAVIEQIFPQIDPNGFVFLYILTIWSAQTQNLLAYYSEQSTIKSDESQELLLKLLKYNVHQMQAFSEVIEKLQETIDEVKKMTKQDAKQIDEIDDRVSAIARKVIELMNTKQ